MDDDTEKALDGYVAKAKQDLKAARDKLLLSRARSIKDPELRRQISLLRQAVGLQNLVLRLLLIVVESYFETFVKGPKKEKTAADESSPT